MTAAEPATDPPWAWIFGVVGVAGTVWSLPAVAGLQPRIASATATLAGEGDWHSVLALTVLDLGAILPGVAVAAAVALALLPGVRAARADRAGRRVDDPPGAVAEMTEFVRRYVPHATVVLHRGPARGSARVCVRARWRPSIIVVGAFLDLWADDRAAAEALLLHEIGHLRAGDHVLLGMSGSYPLLAKAWAPMYTILVLIPPALPDLDHRALSLANRLLVLALAAAPGAVVTPVAVLWAAELAADRFAVSAGGAPALGRALGTRPAYPQNLLTHPPRALRRMVRTVPRGSGTAMAVAVPVVLAGEAVLLAVAAGVTWVAQDGFWPRVEYWYRPVYAWLVRSGLWICLVCALVLVVWPLMARWWTRLWAGSRAAGQVRPGAGPAVVTVAAAALLLIVRPATDRPVWGDEYPRRADERLAGPDAAFTVVPSEGPLVVRVTDARDVSVRPGPADDGIRATLIGSVWTLPESGPATWSIPRTGRQTSGHGQRLSSGDYRVIVEDRTTVAELLVDLGTSPPTGRLTWTRIPGDGPASEISATVVLVSGAGR